MKRRHILLALGWYHPKIHQGIAQFAGENNWHLASEMVFDQKLPWNWKGDGIITSLVRGKGVEKFISKVPVPKAIIGTSSLGIEAPMVFENNREIGELAANFFMQKGFQNFAFFWTNLHQRGMVYEETLEKSGYSCTTLVPPKSDSDSSSLFEWLGKQLQALPKPVAMFCPDDNTAVEVIEACLDSGISVPEEVAVLGVHNDEILCTNLPVTLSSIDNDFVGMGYRAAEILNKLMNGETFDQKHVLISPSRVVERLSTDILAYDNIELTKALRFIKNNYHKYIGVEDVVAVTNVSRRTLYTIFKEFLKRTISEEIHRCRMESAKKLLTNSKIPVTRIATMVGFQDYRIFHRNFKKQEGTSPTKWRKLLTK